MSTKDMNSQTTIFSGGSPRQAFYAELCNALYDKSVLELAELPNLDAKTLQKRLISLTYHINLAAEKLLNCNSPLELDVYNGSWQNPQSNHCNVDKTTPVDTTKWLEKHLAIGLNLPVYVAKKRTEYIELDAVDKIDVENQKVRLNKHGWFHFDGTPASVQNPKCDDEKYRQRRLLKPNKALLTAASCGHCWNYKGGKTTPRRLSLRELLLSADINWKTYRLLK